MIESLVSESKRFKVTLVKSGQMNPAEAAKVKAAMNLMEMAWNSEEFKQWVLGYKYSMTVTTGRLWWKNTYRVNSDKFHYTDVSNKEVYDCLMSGAEYLSPEKDGEADLSITIDRNNSRGVLGYTYPNTPMQYIYSWFFHESSAVEVAMNLAHEYCHKLGFDHEFNYTSQREYSVPYAVGYKVGQIARKLQDK